jgi:hypothetical protein
MRFTTARGALVALLAVVGVSVVGSASASAAACHKEVGAKSDFVCINGERFGSATEAKSESLGLRLTGKEGGAGEFSFKIDLGGEEEHIACTEMPGGSPAVDSGGSGADEHLVRFIFAPRWGKCKLLGALGEKCAVEGEELRWTELIGYTGGSAGNPELTGEVSILPRGSEIWSEYRIVTKPGHICTLAGTRKLITERGKGLICSIPQAGTEANSKEMVCAGTLYVSGQAVSISFTLAAELTGAEKGKKFSIYQGS